MGNVLIVDDSEDLCFSLAGSVRKEGYLPFTAASAAQALEILKAQLIDLAFLDIGLPDLDGIALIAEIKKNVPDLEIVMLTGHNDARTAVSALKAGAVDYILKPFELIEFKKILQRTMRSRLAAKQALLEGSGTPSSKIIGNSPAMHQLHSEIITAASVRAPVLITGETGTGKELVARAIHGLGGENRGIFVKVDCGTLAANVIESELFGHEKGAFTDAGKEKKGLVEMADGGTLFLDEIGNLPIGLQPVLLRMIEESTFRRVGGLRDININVRIIAATNIGIKEEIARGAFREDLYYRLNVIGLRLPPLRERGDDPLLLAACFLKQFCAEMKRKINGFTPEAEKALLLHPWPGNIRELRNCIERAVIYCHDEWLTPISLALPTPTAAGHSPVGVEIVPLKEMERKYIMQVLEATGNNKALAAKLLNISRTTLRDKIR